MRRTLRAVSMLALASGIAIAFLIPDAFPRSATYGPGIPSTADHRLGLRLAILAVALVASALLFAASRSPRNQTNHHQRLDTLDTSS